MRQGFIVEASQDMDQGVCIADVAEKLVPDSLPFV